MKLDDLDIHAIGNTIQLAGAIYADGDRVYLVPLPGELTEGQREWLRVVLDSRPHRNEATAPITVLDMDSDEWQRFLRQTDLLEVEVLAHAEEKGNKGPVKAILRKTARNISQGVSWQVYRRDGYRCRYCGADDVPLTVDHVVLWEHGGPSIPENLVTACRKCNKVRGNTPYAEWLRHPYYKKVSRNIIMAAVEDNIALLTTLDSIPRMLHKPKKRK